jgi:Ser/Thr protein kinase RdoA (MazF antagonist)
VSVLLKKKKFYELTPDDMIHSVELAGFPLTGSFLQLNSYENRVFDFHLESEKLTEFHEGLKERVIAKFYRPGRWSQECILEEHEFLQDLKDAGVPVIAPLKLNNDSTILESEGLFLSVFPKGWGRLPQELYEEDLKTIGRALAHVHNVGEQKIAKHRPILTAEKYGDVALNILDPWIPMSVKDRYFNAGDKILDVLDDLIDPNDFIRIHGDCHKGNILELEGKKKKLFFFMDFDDFCMGPVAQDFWMLFSDESEKEKELGAILEGYEELRHFPKHQLALFEPLRALRVMHYSSWIGKRYDDPMFQQTFPHFKEEAYWFEEVVELERIAARL